MSTPLPSPDDRYVRASKEFGRYISHLAQGLRRVDQRMGLAAYCTGLMLPLARKCVGAMAAGLDPQRSDSRHQSMHHFIAKTDWSDQQLLSLTAQWVRPLMDFSRGGWWVVDDIAFPKRGVHSVGVTRQQPKGKKSKRENTQTAINVWLATETASLPLTWQLYLPRQWAENEVSRKGAGVPDDVRFFTKPQIALQQLRKLVADGLQKQCVWAGIDYGVDLSFRRGLDELGLSYIVCVSANTLIRSADLSTEPEGAGAGPLANLPGIANPEGVRPNRKMTVKTLAHALPESAFLEYPGVSNICDVAGHRFAATRVCAAVGRTQQLPTQWLLVQQPRNPEDPWRYYLSSLPANAPVEQLVRSICIQGRVHRDKQSLVTDIGLGHYEGRGWRGFHHHASVSIAAYGFLLTQRLRLMHQGAAEQYSLPGLAQPEDELLAKSYREALERGTIATLQDTLGQQSTYTRRMV